MPFLPVQPNDSMLTVLLLLSKYHLRSVPVIEMDKPYVENMITQSAVVRGLLQCKGRDWFDVITVKSVSDVGLPFMSPNEVFIILFCFFLGLSSLPIKNIVSCFYLLLTYKITTSNMYA